MRHTQSFLKISEMIEDLKGEHTNTDTKSIVISRFFFHLRTENELENERMFFMLNVYTC